MLKIILSMLCLGVNMYAALPFQAAIENSCHAPAKPLLDILDEFSIVHNGSWPSIIDQTQKHWLRKAGTERWDVTENSPLTEYQFAFFSKLCMTSASFGAKKHYDYAIILGATVHRVRSRFQFLKKEWEKGVQFDKLLILTGDRPLNPLFENEENLLSSSYPFRPGWKHSGPLPKNETEMCKLVFDQLDLPSTWRNGEVLFVDTPQKNGNRPNTHDTFVKWLEYCPKAGSVLIVSEQPFLSRANVLARQTLSGFDIEVVGDELKFETCQQEKRALSVLLDELARILYETVKKNNEAS